MAMSGFFERFALEHIEVGDISLRVRHGGTGPPILLLHGHPRTHTTWHRLVPLLIDRHSVVCPDLRGYGQSTKPPPTSDHSTYSKRSMAHDVMTLMRKLGHDTFAVVGHDRGVYVAFRLAMDFPQAVTHLVALDGVPIGDALARCDAAFATAWWHWFFLGNPASAADEIISANPNRWYASHGKQDHMGAESLADFQEAVADPATVLAMCEDYRAALTVDRIHDDADRDAGSRLRCPVLIVWAEGDDMADLYGDPIAVWRQWADNVTGTAIDSGHHMAEEAPHDLADHLLRFVETPA